MTVAHVRRAVMVGLMLLSLAVPGYSQETTGTILGALVDQTGGVLPGVKVVITSVDTGQTREVVTNNVGQYTRQPADRELRNQLRAAELPALHGARDLLFTSTIGCRSTANWSSARWRR